HIFEQHSSPLVHGNPACWQGVAHLPFGQCFEQQSTSIAQPSPSGLHIGPPVPLLLMPLLLMPLLPLALLPLMLLLPLALLPLTPPAPVPLDALAPPEPLLAPTDSDENRVLSPVPPQLEPAITVKPESKSPAMLHRNPLRDVLFMSSSLPLKTRPIHHGLAEA